MIFSEKSKFEDQKNLLKNSSCLIQSEANRKYQESFPLNMINWPLTCMNDVLCKKYIDESYNKVIIAITSHVSHLKLALNAPDKRSKLNRNLCMKRKKTNSDKTLYFSRVKNYIVWSLMNVVVYNNYYN